MTAPMRNSGELGGACTPPPHHSQVVTPSFASALMSNPVIMRKLCEQYFRKYDVNNNGVLEHGEVMALGQELSRVFALPPLVDDRSVLAELSKRVEPLGLEDFCRWLPNALNFELQLERGGEREVYTPEQQARFGVDELGESTSPRLGITPSYTTALMASPVLLDSLAKQYFRRYDVNRNGVLEYSEVLAVFQDLIQIMAVPPFMPEGDHLRPSIVQFSANRTDSLSLDEFCRWFPMVLGLEPPSPDASFAT